MLISWPCEVVDVLPGSVRDYHGDPNKGTGAVGDRLSLPLDHEPGSLGGERLAQSINLTQHRLVAGGKFCEPARGGCAGQPLVIVKVSQGAWVVLSRRLVRRACCLRSKVRNG